MEKLAKGQQKTVDAILDAHGRERKDKMSGCVNGNAR